MKLISSILCFLSPILFFVSLMSSFLISASIVYFSEYDYITDDTEDLFTCIIVILLTIAGIIATINNKINMGYCFLFSLCGILLGQIVATYGYRHYL